MLNGDAKHDSNPQASNADRADHNQPAPDGKAALNALDDHQRQAGGVSDCTVIWNAKYALLMRVEPKSIKPKHPKERIKVLRFHDIARLYRESLRSA